MAVIDLDRPAPPAVRRRPRSLRGTAAVLVGLVGAFVGGVAEPTSVAPPDPCVEARALVVRFSEADDPARVIVVVDSGTGTVVCQYQAGRAGVRALAP